MAVSSLGAANAQTPDLLDDTGTRGACLEPCLAGLVAAACLAVVLTCAAPRETPRLALPLFTPVAISSLVLVLLVLVVLVVTSPM